MDESREEKKKHKIEEEEVVREDDEDDNEVTKQFTFTIAEPSELIAEAALVIL